MTIRYFEGFREFAMVALDRASKKPSDLPSIKFLLAIKAQLVISGFFDDFLDIFNVFITCWNFLLFLNVSRYVDVFGIYFVYGGDFFFR
jgi:hypothetical protein